MDDFGVVSVWDEDDGDGTFDLLVPYEDNPRPTGQQEDRWLLMMAERMQKYGFDVVLI